MPPHSKEWISGWLLSLMFACALLSGPAAAQADDVAESPPERLDTWQTVIRSAPYWSSQGVFKNILTIRRWVLFGSSYCQDNDRHLLFDHRGRFIGYVANQPTRVATQQKLNQTRATLARQGRVEKWVEGADGTRGYPFALACDQPHVDMELALDRYLGKVEEGQIWGSWDTLQVGDRGNTLSLHEAFKLVFSQRSAEGRIDLPRAVLDQLAGQLMIESGGQARAHSTANARGILQLSPSALSDCQIPETLHWHRLAQMDCALRLTQQNYYNLQPAFEKRFGHLPEAKRGKLLSLLLTQAYHGGATRVTRLLEDEALGAAGRYFADQHHRFSAGDIAFGMLFHNLDRDLLGFSSLYYGADVQLATEALKARLGNS